jgi:hypothetical protein
MIRATALLIVTFLGAPSGEMACAIWCGTAAVAGRHQAEGCHHEGARGPEAERISPVDTCRQTDGASEFLTEARRSGAAAPSVPVPSNVRPADGGYAVLLPPSVFQALSPAGPPHVVLRI